VRTIIEMVQLTRLDCAIASAGLMRMALAQALHHARHRTVFQRFLIDQPLMRSVLADLALDCEGALALTMRVCRAFDLSSSDPAEALRARLLTPVAKYWICKIAPAFIYEAMECIGGNGYVETSMVARLYREAPVNAIWEGSGNVICLDVLRALAREPELAQVLLKRLWQDASDLSGVDEAADFVKKVLSDGGRETYARSVVERIALVAASAALKESVPRVAEIFSRARLGERRGATYGSAAIAADLQAWLLDRALPPP
jgi:putative acyl-CoA dehydrogenase